MRAMPILAAHLICTLLVAIDLLTRALRFQWLLAGLRTPVSFRDAFVMTTVGDAAAAATPNRLGAEPTRLAAAAFAGVPVTAAFVAVTYEILITAPVTTAAAGWLALIYAPRWWHSARPMLAETLHRTWPVVALLADRGDRRMDLSPARDAQGVDHGAAQHAAGVGVCAADAGVAAARERATYAGGARGARGDSPRAGVDAPVPATDGTAHLRVIRAAVRADPRADAVGRGGDRSRIRGRRGGRSGRASQTAVADLARVHDGSGDRGGGDRRTSRVRGRGGAGAREAARGERTSRQRISEI